MAKQVRKKDGVSETRIEPSSVESKKSETAEAAKKSADEMMDKIDDLLKDFNAEKHIQMYIQKPGE